MIQHFSHQNLFSELAIVRMMFKFKSPICVKPWSNDRKLSAFTMRLEHLNMATMVKTNKGLLNVDFLIFIYVYNNTSSLATKG